METTTESLSASPSIKYTVEITASPAQFEAALAFCKDKFGHSGAKSGWWWKVKKKWKDKKFVFTFLHEEDALIFRLSI